MILSGSVYDYDDYCDNCPVVNSVTFLSGLM